MVKELLLEQFTTCFDKNGWFVAVGNASEGLKLQGSWDQSKGVS